MTKYRVSGSAIAQPSSNIFYLSLAGSHVSISQLEDVGFTVEEIPEPIVLPTKQAAVVRIGDGYYFHAGNLWFCGVSYFDNATVEGWSLYSTYEVIFEGVED